MSEHEMTETTHDDRGSVVVWVTLMVAVCALVLTSIGGSAGEAGELARVQSTADLAALAGVDGGRAAASRVARRNGGELRSFGSAGATVTVEVSRLGVVATASAEPDAPEHDTPDPASSLDDS